jgi:hypothetical protein
MMNTLCSKSLVVERGIKMPSDMDYKFTYTDHEGDHITMTCDDNVLEGIRGVGMSIEGILPTFKINLTLVTVAQRNSAAAGPMIDLAEADMYDANAALTNSAVLTPMQTTVMDPADGARINPESATSNWREQYGFADPTVESTCSSNESLAGCFGARSETNTSNLSLREVIHIYVYMICIHKCMYICMCTYIHIPYGRNPYD